MIIAAKEIRITNTATTIPGRKPSHQCTKESHDRQANMNSQVVYSLKPTR